jgi:ADP-ribosylglycohydrolase
LILAVNHDGDSDSTGAICGNILGASYGLEAIPEEWANQVELKELIADTASRLYDRYIKM